MREIIEEIWRDLEKFGWSVMKDKKYYYIQKVSTLETKQRKLEEIDTIFELVGYGEDYEMSAEFECGECHKKFDSRDNLYRHYTEDHEGNKPL